MNAPQPDNETIFHAARDIADPERRRAHVREACGGDETRIALIEALLAAADAPDSLLDRPAASDPAPTIDRPAAEGAGAVIGPYKLIEPIGEGGMGTVWMAQQTAPVKRLVAVKLIKAGMDSRQVIARFEAERQALALMDHPNIAKVLDGGTTSAGRPYFVMDLVKGVPITRYCDEHQLTPRQRLELFIPVCQAVQHAHQKGIIHRDLKPSNVLIALSDGAPVPKVIDFGVAKAVGQPLTEQTLVTGFGSIVGTLEYMAPEQAEINQLDIDTRSDIYALGVLLYELLAGSTPFSRGELEKAGMLEMLRVIREQEPSKPSTKLGTAEGLPTLAANRGTEPAKLTKLVRGELDWIVMKALEKDRGRRYETANAFAMDVQRYLADEPVLAGPPSTRYRLRKFMRRNRGPVLAVSLLVLTLVAGIIGTTWGMIEARRRAEGERQAKQRAEANFALASEAVETYLGIVTNDPKLNQADFHPLRQKLLESAIPFFQKLSAQKGDDPEVEAGRGRAHGRLGDVRHAMGQSEAALQDYEAERATFDRLAAEFPAEPAYRNGLAMSLGDVGYTLHHLGKHREAEAAYRQALGIRERLSADFPTEPKYRSGLAYTYNYLGNLLDDLGLREEAERLHRQAITIFERLAADFPTQPKYRDALAVSHQNLGSLLDDLGRREDAEAAYQRSLDILEKLTADFPAEPEYRRSLTWGYNNLGIVLKDQDKRQEAEALYRKAVATQGKLATDFPNVPEYREDLATSHINLGSLLHDDPKKAKEAEATFRQAIATLEKLIGDFPNVPAYRRHLAAAHNNLGLLLDDLDRREDAEAALRQALAIQETLVADFPNVPQHAVALGGAYCNFGIWVRGGGQPQPALVWFQKAIATLEPVVEKEPRLAEAREFLRNGYKGRAEALDDLGRHAEAARAWERALVLDDGRRKPTIRLRLSRSKNDAAGCLAAAAEYEARNPTDPAGLYDAACLRAVCATVVLEDPLTPGADAPRLAREQGDLAMAWLHRAVAAGFTNVGHMKQDKDLDALREREDFKTLLAELQVKQE